jgi:release factor glutamine methyltransferase
MRIAEAMRHALSTEVDRLDAALMLARITRQAPGTDARTWALAHDDRPLTEAEEHTWRHWLTRRAAGEPLAYLLGEKEFYGLSLHVSPAVLVPRPDTETLVDWALEHLAAPGWAATESPRVMDLGTGSGAIALAVKQHAPHAQLHASDRSAAALAVARGNGQRMGLAVQWHEANWWQGVSEYNFHLVLSNPPYIEEGDTHLQALQFEPASALSAGPTGLDDLRAIIDSSLARLVPGGCLLLEHGHEQSEAVAAMLTAAGFVQVSSRCDLAGIARCTGGRKSMVRNSFDCVPL